MELCLCELAVVGLLRDGFRVVGLLFVVREVQGEGERSLEVARFRGGGCGLMALAFGGVGITGRPNTKSQGPSPRPPLKKPNQTKNAKQRMVGGGGPNEAVPLRKHRYVTYLSLHTYPFTYSVRILTVPTAQGGIVKHGGRA